MAWTVSRARLDRLGHKDRQGRPVSQGIAASAARLALPSRGGIAATMIRSRNMLRAMSSRTMAAPGWLYAMSPDHCRATVGRSSLRAGSAASRATGVSVERSGRKAAACRRVRKQPEALVVEFSDSVQRAIPLVTR
jgi:hypothetical protein